jgi:hypothetical protein
MQTVISHEGQGKTGRARKRKQPRQAGWKRLVLALLPNSAGYRPERHYMRGPGPKWRERHPVSVWAHDISNNA